MTSSTSTSAARAVRGDPSPDPATAERDMTTAVWSAQLREHAVGMVMECLGLPASEARSLLESCAEVHGVPVENLSRWIVDDLSRAGSAHSHVVAAFLSDPLVPATAPDRRHFRVVDVDGHVLYRPTSDACELVRQVGTAPGGAVVQVEAADGTWVDGVGRWAGILGMVSLEPQVLAETDAVVLADPATADGGTVWRMALLDHQGRALAEGTLPPRAAPTPDRSLVERVLHGMGLARVGDWVGSSGGGDRPFHVARIRQAEASSPYQPARAESATSPAVPR